MSKDIHKWAEEHSAEIMEAVDLDDYVGICVGCGESQSGVEPDAKRYKCESCGHYAVYGAEELLMHIPLR